MGSKSSNFHLPLHICSEILSYLPVKSLIRFRSVSKGWKSIIENPNFATFHLNQYTNNRPESHLIVLEGHLECGKRRAQCVTYKTECNPRTSSAFDIPVPHWQKMLGDVDGLLLVQNHTKIEGGTELHEIFLWNPSIRKTLKIPHPPSAVTLSEYFLGFDPSTNDYKVVSISPYYDKHEEPACTLDIFSLKSCSWRPENFSARGGDAHMFHSFMPRNVAGGSSVNWIAHYWVDEVPHYEFAIFDMTSETFSYTLLPKFDQKFGEPDLLTGLLMGFSVKCENFVEIWVFKRDDCSWSRIYKLDFSPLRVFHYLTQPYLSKEGVIIGEFYDSEAHQSVICSYETKTGLKSVVTGTNHYSLSYLGAYMESLVLLAGDN